MGAGCARAVAMNSLVMQSRWLAPMIAASVAGVGQLNLQPLRGDSRSFCAAYFQEARGANKPPQLILFPMAGPELTVPLAVELPASFRLIEFSPDGKAIYGQKTEPIDASGVIKIEFGPVRQSIVPGTVELDTIWHLTVSHPPGKIFVSGCSGTRGTPECGAFEIDPKTGHLRPLRLGIPQQRGGALGPISPDGKHAVSYSERYLGLLDLGTGSVHAIKGISAGIVSNGRFRSTPCTWSPDGRSIVAILDEGIVLIDSNDTSRRRRLGGSGSGPVHWSPDSNLLLLSSSQMSCWPSLYSETLEVLDVGTGKRKVIKSSHCKVVVPTVGWVDTEALR